MIVNLLSIKIDEHHFHGPISIWQKSIKQHFLESKTFHQLINILAVIQCRASFSILFLVYPESRKNAKARQNKKILGSRAGKMVILRWSLGFWGLIGEV